MSSVDPPAANESIERSDAYQQYPQCLEVLMGSCRALNLLPLAAMAQVNEYMQAIAPLVAPTEFKVRGGQNLIDQRRVIDAALALQRVCDDVAITNPRRPNDHP